MHLRVERDPNLAKTTLDQAIKEGVPLLLPGLVSAWPACRLWPGPDGLRRLDQAMAGEVVSVMWSQSDVFFGNLARMQPATMSMHEFLEQAGRAAAGLPCPHLYLAQHSLDPGSGVLKDAPPPACLDGLPLTSTNMWMCIKGSRSNIHYDPYANLLAVAVGNKQVSLWPSSASPFLYPAPLAGDSANHSCVDFAAPDYERHPLYRHAEALKQQVNLQAGDVLYIPDGYWHQVDSTGITIAINFWWRSSLSSLLASQPHQAYAMLRLTAAEATGALLQQLLEAVPQADLTTQHRPQLARTTWVPGLVDTAGVQGGGMSAVPGLQHSAGAGVQGEGMPAAPTGMWHCTTQMEEESAQGSGGGGTPITSGQQGEGVPAAAGSDVQQAAAQPPGLAHHLSSRERSALHQLIQHVLPGGAIHDPGGPHGAHDPSGARAAPALPASQHTGQQGLAGSSGPANQAGMSPAPRQQPGQAGSSSSSQQQPGQVAASGSSGSSGGGWWQLELDPVACLLAAVSPAELVHVLHVMGLAWPSALAQLLSADVLTPLGAYLLTSKLEEAEEQHVFVPEGGDVASTVPSPWAVTSRQFYQQLYSVVPEPEQVFAALLERRQQLMQQVLAKLLTMVLC